MRLNSSNPPTLPNSEHEKEKKVKQLIFFLQLNVNIHIILKLIFIINDYFIFKSWFVPQMRSMTIKAESSYLDKAEQKEVIYQDLKLNIL